MLGFLKKVNKFEHKQNSANLRSKFFSNPYNQWILQDKQLARAFFDFLDRLLPHHRSKLFQQEDIIIQAISAQYSCFIKAPENSSVILLFPEIINTLNSVDNSRGLAVLAHEFGHIYNEHHKRNIPTLESQIEADHMAFEVGLAHGLIEVLLQYPDLDSQTRVSVLTSKLLSNQHS